MSGKPVRAAVSVALVREDSVLLVRRRLPPSQGWYAFPGGRVETDEALEDAARRELAEETGLTAGALAPYRLYRVEGDSVDYDLQVFAGAHAGGEPAAADDADEAMFFTLAELDDLPVLDSVLEVARELLDRHDTLEFALQLTN